MFDAWYGVRIPPIPEGLPLKRKPESLAASELTLSGVSFKAEVPPPFELTLSNELRKTITAAAAREYGDFLRWEASEWDRRIPEILSRFHTHAVAFRGLSRFFERDSYPRSSWPLAEERRQLTDAFHILSVMTESAQSTGADISPMHRVLTQFWWYRSMHALSPEMAGIHRWFTGMSAEQPPLTPRYSVEAGACVDALRAQLPAFFTACTDTLDRMLRWSTITARVSAALEPCVAAAKREDLTQLHQTAEDLLGSVYDRYYGPFIGTLAGRVAHDDLPTLEERFKGVDICGREVRGEQRYSGPLMGLVGSRNRALMFDNLVSAFTMTELRLRPGEPHDTSIDFLQQVIRSGELGGQRTLKAPIDAIGALKDDQHGL